ncbi:MAG: DUF4876 domain-containing protein [Marinilabiliales bacterium]|nr:DUF4876 domain-containing protein [Marinilabiliales bacterium]
MKKSISKIAFLLLALLLVQCKREITPAHLLNLTLTLPKVFGQVKFPPTTAITLTNTETGRIQIKQPDENGLLSIPLAEANYKISCDLDLPIDGLDYIFHKSMNSLNLNQDTDLQLELILGSNTGGFVFKEIYYVGSMTPEGKQYGSDQFHEIYNNTTDTLYADKLCIGLLQQVGNNPNVWLNPDGTVMDNLPLTYQVWIVPGSGKEHPVYPGQSFIIAQDGINHKKDPNGNPNSPVDLSHADWETYMEVSGKDLDSPSVPNLTMMYTTSTTINDWSASVNGSAVILFRLPVEWKTYVDNPANFKTLPGSSSSTKYFMVNKNYVLDAVEIVSPDETRRYKRLPESLDAGLVFTVGGSYCGKSIRRKARFIIDGRVIYKDTNNSTADFLHDLIPTPGINPTAIEK